MSHCLASRPRSGAVNASLKYALGRAQIPERKDETNTESNNVGFRQIVSVCPRTVENEREWGFLSF